MSQPGRVLLNSHSFIHSDYFYSASSNLLLLRGAPETARIMCRNFTPKSHRQLRGKDCPRSIRDGYRAGVEPMTLPTKGVDSTNAPHTPHTLNKVRCNAA